ncbi:MAG: ribonuclease domain-containing protein [Firmicutes bacterium]|nr:ribonuclease domain-containing protein [Bacillota bacterium]
MKKLRIGAAFLSVLILFSVLTSCAYIGDIAGTIIDAAIENVSTDDNANIPDSKEDTSGAADSQTESQSEPRQTEEAGKLPDENGVYTSKDDVALYIRTFNKLPGNFITKEQARALGWSGGGLDKYASGKCIGGDRFGNYEGLLPRKSGRIYYECDIDTLGEPSRGAKRIVFSNDGLIYYTEDHYQTFTLIYGEK